jgi:hypothetical protein
VSGEKDLGLFAEKKLSVPRFTHPLMAPGTHYLFASKARGAPQPGADLPGVVRFSPPMITAFPIPNDQLGNGL